VKKQRVSFVPPVFVSMEDLLDQVCQVETGEHSELEFLELLDGHSGTCRRALHSELLDNQQHLEVSDFEVCLRAV
jgi:hypothetical protein